MYLVVRVTEAGHVLTTAGLFIRRRAAIRCADELAQLSKVNVHFKVVRMEKEWQRQWRKHRAEVRRQKRLRKMTTLTHKRNKIDKKLKEMRQGG